MRPVFPSSFHHSNVYMAKLQCRQQPPADALLTVLFCAAAGPCSSFVLFLLQEESYFVGRIVCEAEGGSLNDTAVVLEGDTALSEGARAALDLSQLSSYRLFPGQVGAHGRWLRECLQLWSSWQ
jgi:hypothetical protein